MADARGLGRGVQPEKLLFGGDSAYRDTSFRYILDADKGSDFSGTLSYRCPRGFYQEDSQDLDE